MGKNPDVIEATHMVLHLMKAGMAIYGYPAVAIHRGMVQKNGELEKIIGLSLFGVGEAG